MKFNEIIDSALNSDLRDQDVFEKDFRVIASLIENKKESKNDGSGITNSFIFSVNLDKIIDEYEQSYQSFNTKLSKFYKGAVDLLDKVMTE